MTLCLYHAASLWLFSIAAHRLLQNSLMIPVFFLHGLPAGSEPGNTAAAFGGLHFIRSYWAVKCFSDCSYDSKAAFQAVLEDIEACFRRNFLPAAIRARKCLIIAYSLGGVLAAKCIRLLLDAGLCARYVFSIAID